MNKMIGALAAATFSVAGVAHADIAPASIFQCKIEPYGGGKPVSEGGGGWIPDSTSFAFSDGWNTVKIQNYIIDASAEGSAEAEVKQQTNGRVKFKWRSSLPTNQVIPTPVGYRVEFDPETLTGKMRASVAAGYRGRIGGNMSCKKA